MNKFKESTKAIDRAIAFGISSVEMLAACSSAPNNEGAIKGRLVSYIIENHMDEDMEMFLNDTMGYVDGFHRIQVDFEGNISF